MKHKSYVFGVLGIFAALFLLFDLCIWIIPHMYYGDIEYPYWEEQKDYITEGGKDNEILFMGDSVPKVGILPDVISDKSYNISIGGVTAIEMYYALNTYLKRNAPPKKIFIAFSPIHYAHLEWFHTRTVYFHYLSFSETMEAEGVILNDEDILFYEKPGILLDDIECFLRFPNKYYLTIRDSRLKRKALNDEKYRLTREAKGRMYFPPVPDWKEEYEDNKYLKYGFKKRESIEYYLKKLLYLAGQNDIEVHIIQMPVNNLTYQSIKNSGYLADFENYMQSLKDETGADIETKIPVYDSEYFDDQMHLSKQGAKIYSKFLKEKYNL